VGVRPGEVESTSARAKQHQRVGQITPTHLPLCVHRGWRVVAGRKREKERERERKRGRERGFPSSRTFPPGFVLYPDCPLFPSLSPPLCSLRAHSPGRSAERDSNRTAGLIGCHRPCEMGHASANRASPSFSLNRPSSVTSWQSLACVQLLMCTRNPQKSPGSPDRGRTRHLPGKAREVLVAGIFRVFTFYGLRRAHRAFFSANISLT